MLFWCNDIILSIRRFYVRFYSKIFINCYISLWGSCFSNHDCEKLPYPIWWQCCPSLLCIPLFFKMLPLLWIAFIAAFFYFSRKLILLNLQKYIYGLSLIIIIIGIIFLVINSTFISHSHDINEQVTSTLKSLN